MYVCMSHFYSSGSSKSEGLKLNASKGVVGVALIYSLHRTALEDRIT